MGNMLSIEQETRKLHGRKHAVELQSIRGIAALVVLIDHSSLYLNTGPIFGRIREIFFNGHASVVCFFVLSGFVLTLSFQKEGISIASALAFYARRVFRIYPALWFACLVALGWRWLAMHMTVPPAISPWGIEQFSVLRLSPTGLVAGFLAAKQSFPIPIWSLFIELVASLLMPGFVLLLFRAPRIFGVLLVVLAIVSFARLGMWMSVGIYLVDFLIGAGAYILVPKIAPWISGRALWIGVGGVIILCFFRLLGPWGFLIDYHAPLPALLEALAAAALLLAVYIEPAPFGLLRRSVIVWLGDISYSLYVVHLPLVGILGLLSRSILSTNSVSWVGAVWMILATAVLATALAVLSYRFIELPCMRAGKSLAAAIKRGPQLQPRVT